MAELESAGFWIRFLAHVIDTVVLNLGATAAGIVLIVIATAVTIMLGSDSTSVVESVEKMGFIAWIGGAVVILVYHTAFEGIAGSTVGKRIVGVQVVDVKTIGPITFAQAMRRSIAFFVDSLLFGMVAAHFMNESVEKQRIGDLWAETRVVRRRSLPPLLRTRPARMFWGFLAAEIAAFIVNSMTFVFNYLWYTRGA